MTEPSAPPQDAVLIVTLCEDDRVEIWSRQGRSRAEVVEILRWMADGFASSDVKRIR